MDNIKYRCNCGMKCSGKCTISGLKVLTNELLTNDELNQVCFIKETYKMCTVGCSPGGPGLFTCC